MLSAARDECRNSEKMLAGPDGDATVLDTRRGEQADHIVIVGSVIDTRDPGRIRRARVREGAEYDEGRKQDESEETTPPRPPAAACLIDDPFMRLSRQANQGDRHSSKHA